MIGKSAGVAALLVPLAACQTMSLGRAPACEDRTVQVYFETDSAEVTQEGKAVLAQAAAVPRRCQVDRVEVLGLADAAGDPQANLELSKRRAQAVTTALAGAGLPAGEFAVAAAGQADAVTDDGANRPVRRRADIVLRLSPRP
jgi:outer membrane protein OmpA-like peptidoglycan-associated protein